MPTRRDLSVSLRRLGVISVPLCAESARVSAGRRRPRRRPRRRRRRGRRRSRPRSGCGRGRGSAGRRPATSCPRRPAGRCRRRRAGSTPAGRRRPRRSAASTAAAGTDVVDHERDVLLGQRLVGERRRARRRRRPGHQGVEVDLERGGAAGQPVRRAHPRVELAGVADLLVADEHPGAPARVPGHPLGLLDADVDPELAASARTTSTASDQSAARPSPHQPAGSRSPAAPPPGTAAARDRLEELLQLGLGWAATPRRTPAPGRGRRGRRPCRSRRGRPRWRRGRGCAPAASSTPGSSVVV